MSGDSRFSAMHSAPIFKQTKKENFKVKIDDRFKSLLSDERFQSVTGKVDKYGRKSKGKNDAKKVVAELKEFYDIDQEAVETKSAAPSAATKKSGTQGGSMESRLDYLNKLARGEISDESSSDSDASSDGGDDSDSSDSTSDAEDEDVQVETTTKSALEIPGQEEPELVTDVSSTRIAIQNCDWENLTAEDIMVVLQSFCPPGSGHSVRKVTVYVSDFGKKRMEAEARFGPQGIWKKGLAQEEDEDSENEDLYEGIMGVDEEEDEDEGSEGEEHDGSDHSGSDESGSDESGDSGSDSNSEESAARAAPTSRKSLKKGDFVRKNGAVGIVMHTDLKLRGKASRHRAADSEGDSGDSAGSDAEDASSAGGRKGAQQKKLKDGEGYDEIALRKYELSKLRYYFAIAECDSARTANMLYEELDGVEMEASSMVFDLSLVPEDLDFSQREVRDSHSASASGAVNPSYKPPDFVVNALQHTKVQCSWDEGEKQRERQLSNFSSWRNLNESELQQYVADSNSSDDDEDEEEEEDQDDRKVSKPGKQKKQQKAAAMRRMLLGDDVGSQASDDSAGEGGEDDFFEKASQGSDDGGNGGDGMYDSDGEIPDGFDAADRDGSDEEEGGKTLTYMPELGKELLAKKRGAAPETPYEAEQRKMAEKKKARKAAKKAYQEQLEAEKKAAVQGAKKGKSKGGAQEEKLTAEEARKRAELELLFDDDEGNAQGEDDYDMRQLVQAEKAKAKGKKNKRKKGNADAAAVAGSDFKLDTSDPRFSKLFEGDALFGIDKTSTEFRPTPAIKEIISEQAKRRAQKERRDGGRTAPEEMEVDARASGHKAAQHAEEATAVDVSNLANKLKRKFGSS